MNESFRINLNNILAVSNANKISILDKSHIVLLSYIYQITEEHFQH